MPARKKLPKLLAMPKDRRPPSVKRRPDLRNQEELLVLREKCFDLRAVERKTFAQIGQELGIATTEASRHVKYIAELKVKGLIEKDESVRVEMQALYEALLARWVPFVMSDDFVVQGTKEGKDGPTVIQLDKWQSAGLATDKVLKVLDQMAKLNGFYSSSDLKGAAEVGKAVATETLKTLYELGRQNRAPIPAQVIECHAHE